MEKWVHPANESCSIVIKALCLKRWNMDIDWLTQMVWMNCCIVFFENICITNKKKSITVAIQHAVYFKLQGEIPFKVDKVRNAMFLVLPVILSYWLVASILGDIGTNCMLHTGLFTVYVLTKRLSLCHFSWSVASQNSVLLKTFLSWVSRAWQNKQQNPELYREWLAIVAI